MTTKTKIPTYAERVEQTKHALADALAEQKAATAALEQAQAQVATMRQGRRAGDRTNTPAEAAQALAVARALVDVCSDDLESANQKVRRARARLLNEDLSLADALATALGGMAAFTGYAIVATAEVPSLPDAIERPTLFLVQQAAAERDTISGRVFGSVEMYLHRPSWGRTLDVENLPDALARHEMYVDTHNLGSHTSGGASEDRARVTVRGLWHDVPLLRSVNGTDRFGQTLAGRIAAHLSVGRRGEVRTPREGALGSTTAYGAAVTGQGEARVVSTDQQGSERRTTVDVTLAFGSSTVGVGTMADGVRDVLPTYKGKCEAGLGRIESVEYVRTGDRDTRAESRIVRVSVRFVFRSRVPA